MAEPIPTNLPEIPKKNKGGRPRGKTTKFKTVKEDMLWVYRKMGGKKMLLDWAKHHRDSQEVFYKELLRLLPKEIDMEMMNPGNIKLVMDIDDKMDWDDGRQDNQVQGEQNIPIIPQIKRAG